MQLDYFLNKFSDKINSSITRAKNIAFTFTNKFVIRYKSFDEIHEFTDIPFERIKELASKIFS